MRNLVRLICLEKNDDELILKHSADRYVTCFYVSTTRFDESP
jgi:hypothetical protein